MKFLEFQKKFRDFPVISTQDIRQMFGKVNPSLLSKWERKGYLVRLRKKLYFLKGNEKDSLLIANQIQSSYVSLEYALSFYHIIPEIPQSITSITVGRKLSVVNELGQFYYYHVQPDLYFDYFLKKSKYKALYFKIAKPEKALFDFFYLKKDLKDEEDVDSLRINLPDKFNLKKMENYLKRVKAPQIIKRVSTLVKYCQGLKNA